jgi:hypothetical protein
MYHPIYLMDSDSTLSEISTPKGDHLDPPPSSHSIATSSYELRPGFIAMVREQSFSRDKDESHYSHLHEFEQLCSCVVIAGMSQDTLKWKLFPFSLMGRAKQWYSLNVRSMEGEWESLRKAFCLTSNSPSTETPTRGHLFLATEDRISRSRMGKIYEDRRVWSRPWYRRAHSLATFS